MRPAAHAAGTEALRLQLELALYRIVALLPSGWPADPVRISIQSNGAHWILVGAPIGVSLPSVAAE